MIKMSGMDKNQANPRFENDNDNFIAQYSTWTQCDEREEKEPNKPQWTMNSMDWIGSYIYNVTHMKLKCIDLLLAILCDFYKKTV